MDALSDLSTANLAKVFNAVTGAHVKKFESKSSGLGRTRAAIDVAGMTLEQALAAAGFLPDEKGVNSMPTLREQARTLQRAAESEPAPEPVVVPAKLANDPVKTVDVAVLGMAREKPCRMRDFMAAIPGALGWDGVNPLTAKRRVRSAINRLVTAGELTWTDKAAMGGRHFVAKG